MTDLFFRLEISTSVIASLPAFHALTGCDTTSSFCGKGKKTAYKLLKKESLASLLSGMGESWDLSMETIKNSKQYVLALYGSEMENFNLARYRSM